MSPKLDVIEMGCVADTVHSDELVLAAVERALTGIGLRPDRQVQHLIVCRAARLEQFAEMPPIHAHEMDCAVARHRSDRRQALLKELDKTRARELARCHGKFAVLDLAATDDVTDANTIMCLC